MNSSNQLPQSNLQEFAKNSHKRKLNFNSNSLESKKKTPSNKLNNPSQKAINLRYSTPQTKKTNTNLTYTDPQKSKSSKEKENMTDKNLFKRELSLFGPFEKLIEKGSEGSVYNKGKNVLKVPHSIQHKRNLNPQILEFLRKYPRLFAAPITNGICEIQQDAGPDLFSIISSIISFTPITNTQDQQIKKLLFTKSYDTLLLHYLTPISEGIARLHHHNIIHGDIKLENLAKKIIDFGQTQYIHEDTFLKGTPQYMHPVLYQENFPLKFHKGQLSKLLHQKLKNLSISNENYLALNNITCENLDSYFISTILENKKWFLQEIEYAYESFKNSLTRTPIGSPDISTISENIKIYSDLYYKLCQFRQSHNADFFKNHEKQILKNLFNYYKNETVVNNFTTLNIKTLQDLHTKTSLKIAKIEEDLKERLSSEDIASLTHKNKLYLMNLQYIENILKTIEEYKQHETFNKIHHTNFVTHPKHKKSYDIYALSLSICLVSLSCLNTQESANLVSNITNGLISKEIIPQEINNLMQTQFRSSTNVATKLINFILRNNYLSSDIKEHKNSAYYIHKFILSLNPVHKVSGSDTSSENSETTTESFTSYKPNSTKASQY